MQDADPLAVLRRWEDSGGTWVVLARTADGVDLALLTCDGGEQMSRLVSRDPAVLAHVGTRARSDDGTGPDPVR
jgi:hypothetical protein